MFRQVLLPLGFTLLALSLFAVRPAWAQQDPQAAALACQDDMSDRQQAFVGCWARQMMSPDQKQVISCYHGGETFFEFAACSHGAKLSQDQTNVLNCVAQSRGTGPAFTTCLGRDYMTPDEQQAIGCVEHNSSFAGFGACMAGGRFLTPEQEVTAQCAVSTAGEPVSFTTCVGGQLTINELNKCVPIGIGGRGCFGDNNTITVAVRNAWHDIVHGPGPGNEARKFAAQAQHNIQNLFKPPGRCSVVRNPFGHGC